MQVVDILIQQVVPTGASMLADYIRNRPQPPSRLAPIPPPSAEGDGCPVCRAHRESAEAMALLNGLSRQVDATGEIPSGLGGTIPLARKSVEDARASLVDTAMAFPNLRNEIEDADRRLALTQSDLSTELQPSVVSSVALHATEAWEACYELARVAFAPKTQGEHDPLIEWLNDVKDHPEMTNDEAISRLKGLLHDDRDTDSGRGGDAARDVRGPEPSRRRA